MASKDDQLAPASTEEDTEAESVEPFETNEKGKGSTSAFPPAPQVRDEARIVNPYTTGRPGETTHNPGLVVKDMRPNILPSDAPDPEDMEEVAPKDSSVPASAEFSSPTMDEEPSQGKTAKSSASKDSGQPKANGNSSQTSSSTQKTKAGKS